MSFGLTQLNAFEVNGAIETPFADLYKEFVDQFDRVSPVEDGWGRVDGSRSDVLTKMSRNPRHLAHIANLNADLHVAREVEVSLGNLVGYDPLGGPQYYASYLTLNASGVELQQEPQGTEAASDNEVWVPGVSIKYDALIPRPLQLLREFGLDMSVRIQPFDEFGNNRRTVFETDVVTEANQDSYDATMVKPALYVVTQAFAGMPDAQPNR